MNVKSKIILFILNIIKSVPLLNAYAYKLSCIYIDVYRNYSYNPTENGEQKIILKLSTLFKNNIVFIDVGANVGEWSSFVCAQFKNYSGHLFEISADTFDTLKCNLGENVNLTLNNTGLSSQNTIVKYKDYGKNDGGNTMIIGATYHSKPYKLISTKVITGDTYLSKNNINRVNILKIDTEGAEYSVLQGFEKSFQNQLIDVVQFEYGYTHADAKTLMREFFEYFESYGYIVGRLCIDGVLFKNFEYTDNDFKSGPNYIACLPKYKTSLEKF